MKEYIYLDNAATSKLDLEAFNYIKKYLLDYYGNPSQPYSFSREPKNALAKAREIIAKCINAEASEIYFTSGGTESDNWVIKSFANIDKKNEIITSSIEHHAIINSCKSINNKTIFLPVDEFGIVDDIVLKNTLTENNNKKLVSIMLVNNEIGTIEPLKDLSKIVHNFGGLIHTDAVQAVGHIEIDVKELGVDFLSASAHKFNGPKGIGFLYIKNGINLPAFINGGAQQFGLRAGTENVANIIGMAIALQNNINKLHENRAHIKKLENIFISKLNYEKLDYKRNGTNQLQGLISLSFKNKEGEVLLHRLDLKGVAISTGSACDSKNTQISHVLKAINLEKDYALGTIRVSIGKDNTEEEINKVSDYLINIIKK